MELTKARIEQATKEAVKGINKEFVWRNRNALIAMYYADKNFKPVKEYLKEGVRKCVVFY